MGKRIVVIGAGLAGLGTAALLAKEGFEVVLVEKNGRPGGRAQVWEEKGFLYDMGPSWYLMPEVFERFFGLFGKSAADHYRLVRLDPSYRVFTGGNDRMDIPADPKAAGAVFEKIEPGAGKRLEAFLALSKRQYETAMAHFLYREYGSLLDFLDPKILVEARKLNFLSSVDGLVSKYFADPRLRHILEYTMVFIGGSPKTTPAFYSLMTHIDMNLGVWYPMGGINMVASGLESVCRGLGVRILLGTPATKIETRGGRAVAVATPSGGNEADAVVSNADYHHTEYGLLRPEERGYSDAWWNRRVLSPSAFIIYLGLGRKIDGLLHHNLYFHDAWDEHFDTIFKTPSWPEKFSYYVSCPSKTDPATAPAGMENLFFLVPVAPGIEDGDEVREAFYDKVMDHFEGMIGEKVRDSVVVRRIFSQRDFVREYHSFKGSAFGLAHTLFQTAAFRPAMRSRTIGNLYYSGQYPHPGVGMPMTLICAEIAAAKIAKDLGG